MHRFLAAHGSDPEVARAVADTVALAGDGADPAATLVAWIDEDRKAAPLKEIQGLMWSEGFRTGASQGHIYPDALAALRRWHAAGIALWIFSSGSLRTQRDFFAHCPEGDLTFLFRGHFDTAVGPKIAADSYRHIAAEIAAPPARILFLSDNPRELAAAQASGLQVSFRSASDSGRARGHRAR
jgi:enolase-phosphatase E1